MNQKQSQHQFESFVMSERQRLTELLLELDKRQAGLDEERAAVQNELAAIDAYYQIKTGQSTPRGGHRPRRAPRAASRRARILELLRAEPAGLARNELLAGLGIGQGDKEARAVSSTLANMKKAGEIDNPEGRWTAGSRRKGA